MSDLEMYTNEDIEDLFGGCTVLGVIGVLMEMGINAHSTIEEDTIYVVTENGDYFCFDENGIFTDVEFDCWCC